MHKGVILLVEAQDKVEAKNKVISFLNEYQDRVFDWYTIGGRWSGTLDSYDPEKDQKNIDTCSLCNGTGQRTDAIGNDLRLKNPDYNCNGCQGKGKSIKWPTQWGEYDNDIMPLSDCIEVVKSWSFDSKEESDKELSNMNKEQWKNSKSMQGYFMQSAGRILAEEFCLECNVFNTKEYNYSISDNLNDWYAIIIDIHN